jgi:hypothetical protein
MAGPLIDPDTGRPFEEAGGAAGEEPVFHSREERNQAPAAENRHGSLSAPEARRLIHEKHGISIPSDDPILMVVTLQAEFANDLSRMLAGHDKAIEAAINSTAGSTVQAVNEALETLKDKTVRAGLNNAMALVERQAVTMEKFQRTNRRHLWVIVALTATTWAGLGLALWLLWGLLR